MFAVQYTKLIGSQGHMYDRTRTSRRDERTATYRIVVLALNSASPHPCAVSQVRGEGRRLVLSTSTYSQAPRGVVLLAPNQRQRDIPEDKR